MGAGRTRIRADQIWKPFIAALNGFALGGGLELAMECDIRIAAEHARLGQPEVNIGFMPGAGGTQRLPRFVARSYAAEILLTGEHITAQEALRIGLVSRVVPLAQLMSTAKQIAETICKKGPIGVRATKEAMIRGYNVTLDEGLQLERDLANRVRASDDFMEGARAFAEKRPPQYKAK
jgi:enoyl-CoA hydratase